MKAPMLIPLIALVVGIGAAHCGLGYLGALILLCSGVTLYLCLICKQSNPILAYRFSIIHYVWIFLIFSGIGTFTSNTNKPYRADIKEMDSVIAISGKITEIANLTSGDKAMIHVDKLYLLSGDESNVNNMNVLLYSDALEYGIDDIVVIPGSLKELSDLPETFWPGYKTSSNYRGIYYSIRCEGNKIKKYSHRQTLSGTASKIRDKIVSTMEKSSLNKNTTDFFITILLGDRSYLEQDMRKLFADAGISHILALSGMHIGIISMILLWLLIPLNIYGEYRLRLVLTVTILFIYAFISGWQPSTVRATLMVSSVVTCVLLERKHSSWNGLLLATFCILLFSPHALFDIGLQLSFISVSALIFFVNPLNPINQHEHQTLHKIVSLVIATLAATLTTWCVSAYYFGRIPIVFLTANMLTLPLLPTYMTAGIIYFLMTAMGRDITWFATGLEKIMESYQSTLEIITNSTSSAISFQPSLFTVFLWLAFIVGLAIIINSETIRKKYFKIGTISITTSFILFVVSIPLTQTPVISDGFILKRAYDSVSIITLTDGKEETIRMATGSLSTINAAQKSIISLDCNIDTTNVSQYPKLCDILILASGYKGTVSTITKIIRPNKIVVHPSIKINREEEIMHECDKLGISVHSLRSDGPYKFVI